MGSKKIAILLEFSYEDMEVWYPKLRFQEEGMEVFTVAPEKGKVYTGKKGYPCKSDLDIDSVVESNMKFDALILPGGWAPDYLRRNKKMIKLVQDMMAEGKPVGSICHGPWMLCSAKCIKGRKMTCFHAIKDDVENAGGLYEDAPVVVDKNLVTSRIPDDLPFFMKALLAQLK